MLGKFDFSFHISDNGVIIESEKDFKKMAVSKISVDELKKRILSVKYLVND